MSLINDVLRDLDARRALPCEGAPGALADLAPARPPRRRAGRAARLGALLLACSALALLRPGAEPGGDDPGPLHDPAVAPRSDAPDLPPVAAAPPPAGFAEPAPGAAPASTATEAAGSAAETASALETGPSDAELEAWAAELSEAAAVPEPSGSHGRPALRSSARDRAEGLFRDALGRAAAADPGAAEALLRDALDLDPRHRGARLALATLLAGRGLHPEALAVCAEGSAIDPADPAFPVLDARIRAEAGDPAGAIASLGRARVAFPHSAETHGLLAALLQRQGRSDDAVAHFERALQLEPARAAWWLGLGLAHEARADRSAAALAYRGARRSGGLEPAALAWLDERLARLGDAP